MTIKSINVTTGKKITRKWLKKELDAHNDAILRDAPTEQQLKERSLQETEGISFIALIVEEIIDNIENGKPLSQQTKDWVNSRKDLKGLN